MINLGVDVIYIINRSRDKERLLSTLAELNKIDTNNIEIIRAVEGEDLPSIGDLIESKKLAPRFLDPIGLLTRNIIATALSHHRTITQFNSSEYDTCLILEDDIKFTDIFWKEMYNNGIKQFISDIKSNQYDVVYWGKESTHIPTLSNVTNNLNIVNTNVNAYGAHAYQLNKEGASKLLKDLLPVQYAADVFLETCDIRILSPISSFILQEKDIIPTNKKRGIINSITGLGLSGEFSSTRVDILNYFDEWTGSKYMRNIQQAGIYKDIPVEKVTFKNKKLNNGQIVENWSTIHFSLK